VDGGGVEVVVVVGGGLRELVDVLPVGVECDQCAQGTEGIEDGVCEGISVREHHHRDDLRVADIQFRLQHYFLLIVLFGFPWVPPPDVADQLHHLLGGVVFEQLNNWPYIDIYDLYDKIEHDTQTHMLVPIEVYLTVLTNGEGLGELAITKIEATDEYYQCGVDVEEYRQLAKQR
jgi:hypothetical protein